ncbi:MAG: UDP-N-acetylmuramoyl-tripeptide--D-alanyl-D-alanine ligase [Kiritimatiellae bacterium]|nr:UDP-N-acetylmuramoyl-tripeptide--D-alanyl-D-alanine ligase [Kiritimatiellia bacterium]
MKYTLDSRAVKPGMGFVALKGEKADGRDFIQDAVAAGAVDVIIGLDELQRRARERRRGLRAKVVGVTGSAGKTTTKELLKVFLSAAGRTYATEGNFNNHIGLPLTILNCPDDADFLVLEMGSNHPGEIAALCEIAAPDVGVVTNIGTAHMEFFGSREGIAKEKGTLLERAATGFSAAGEPLLRGTVDTRQEWMRRALAGVLPGEHNVANACLAYAAAESFGVSKEAAAAALKDFSLPGARWRKVEKNGAVFIDDTYNANPDSMIAALDAFVSEPCEGRRIAVLGDMFELGPTAQELHRKVFEHAASLGVRPVIAVGEMSSRCRCDAAFGGVEELKGKLADEVSAGDLVLLKASHAVGLGRLLE